MTTFYTGTRPVLKGRTSSGSVHFWKGTVGTYSNWDLMNTSHVLDGAPNTSVTPGTGDYPHDYFTSYIWRGRHHIAPMPDPGNGTRADGYRYRPLTYRGLDGAKAFGSSYGHAYDRANDYANWTNFVFAGLTSAVAIPSSTTGHEVRYTSTINSFGSFGPYINKGVTPSKAFSSSYGQALPSAHDSSDYRSSKVNEWRGVASARAL